MTTESKSKAPRYYQLLWGFWIGGFIGGIVTDILHRINLAALTERISKLEDLTK